MSEFATPVPAFSDAEIQKLVREIYGIDAAASALVGDRDQNVALKSSTGEKYVLKIANAAEDVSILALQAELADHLAAVDPSLGIAQAVKSLSGASIPQITAKDTDGTHAVRLLPFVEGQLLAHTPRTLSQVRAIGAYLGRLTRALQSFGSPVAHRPDFMWSLDNATGVESFAGDILDPADRALVEREFFRYKLRCKPHLQGLRKSVLYQDANDHNIIMQADDPDSVAAVIDFGDVAYGSTVNDLAIALAYLLLDADDIYATARALISGYVGVCPLQPKELEILFDLAAMRLVMSVCISSNRAKDFPDNDYLTISQAPALACLRRLDSLNREFLSCFARHVGGCEIFDGQRNVLASIRSAGKSARSLLGIDIQSAAKSLVSMREGARGAEYIEDQSQYTSWLTECMAREGSEIALGTYLEDRTCYQMDQFQSEAGESRSVHLGVDVFAPAGMSVHTPLDATVVSVTNNDAALDYGPTIILAHNGIPGEGTKQPFYTLYGHLSLTCLKTLKPGQKLAAGDKIAEIGDISVNGGWAPHLHFQVMTSLLGEEGNFFGACEPSVVDVWQQITPDPNFIMGLAPESFKYDPLGPDQLLEERSQLMGPSLSVSYDKPLKIVRGKGAYLYDHTGRQYLDCVNNICHVGHANPRVVTAMAKQAAILNTNTRYLHETILTYSDRLLATLPDNLEVIYFVCSGSEANELALRMARNATGREDIITLDWGYHGNTAGLIDISPYKFNRKGGTGRKDHVHIAKLPEAQAAEPIDHYLESVQQGILASIDRCGDGPAAMIAESISGCGGQVVLPDGYLKSAFEMVQRAGGVAIADEVQVGFGRTGKGMWSFVEQGARPDIVTMGKPMGNGHPVAAVATTRRIADAFANGMEYFNSFGGNPVSMATASAVLSEIEDKQLIAHADAVGSYLMDEIRKMSAEYPAIMDVRGRGLFIGVECTGTLGGDIVSFARDRAILLSTDGPHNTVIKIKPPMVFSYADADTLMAVLKDGFAHLSP
ncbi:aminotransferase class III-fold pyridoxal phosphate-dependent enzyme [Kordiimonas sediminis]|uniref:aminotransferase class III-fold pyridoxal phosphate-dependent enzyme n=1 Tax=Kordiimonas sediminis TaxID=1735581 RepID=UPI00174C8D54|nr:aminotransferase class III-fold pyridoxal phosphate-dependent enzyme [Kordiimonas sediminis]